MNKRLNEDMRGHFKNNKGQWIEIIEKQPSRHYIRIIKSDGRKTRAVYITQPELREKLKHFKKCKYPKAEFPFNAKMGA